MKFSQYIETCEVLLDYPKIGGDDIIEDYEKRVMRNLLRTKIYVHSRRLIAEFPKYGIKVDMTGPFNKSQIKEGNLQSTTSRCFKMHMLYQFQ